MGGGVVMYTEEEASADDGQSGRDTITRGTQPTIPPESLHFPRLPSKA